MSLRRRPKRSGEMAVSEVLERLGRESGDGAWVAHGGMLDALVRHDEERFDQVLHVRVRAWQAESLEVGLGGEAGTDVDGDGLDEDGQDGQDGQDRQAGVEQVLEDAAAALARRAWAVSRACFGRSVSPAFIDGAGRLAGEEYAVLDGWVGRLARRHTAMPGRAVLDDAGEQGFGAWAVLVVLAQYVDAASDDAAKVCEVGRDVVLDVVWDGYVEPQLSVSE